MRKIIYLDNASSTKIRKPSLNDLIKTYNENYANASSTHQEGRKSKTLLEETRKFFSNEINCKTEEIIFTSGSTESNNLAIQGYLKANPKTKTILTTRLEHHSILETLKNLNKKIKVVYLKTSTKGEIDLKDLENKSSSNSLLTITHANSETGTLQNLGKIGKICKNKKITFHVDATQTIGKIPLPVKDLKINLLTASGNKIGGPRGVGILFIDKNTKISPIIYGGSQERSLRPGTENLPCIVAFKKALTEQKRSNKNVKKISAYFLIKLKKLGAIQNSPEEKTLPDIINVTFPKKDHEKLQIFLSSKGIMTSIGSACNSLKETKTKKEAIRFSLSEENTKSEIRYTIKKLKEFLSR